MFLGVRIAYFKPFFFSRQKLVKRIYINARIISNFLSMLSSLTST